MGKDIINFLKLCALRTITKIGGGDRGIDFATLHSPCLIRVAHRHTPSAFRLRFEPSCRVRIPKSTKQTKKMPQRDILLFVAEIGGFEPSIQLPVYAISSRAHSTSSAISPKRVFIIYI